jgi:ribosomal protein L24E
MLRCCLLFGTLLLLTGCGKDSPAPNENGSDKEVANSSEASRETPQVASNRAGTSAENSQVTKPVTIKPLKLGALGGGNASPAGTSGKSSPGGDTMNSVLEAMQPLQVFLGQWNTTTKSMGAGSASWVWDFRTDKSQPALVMSTKGHPYFESVRLTFRTDKQKFQLTAQDKDKQQRTYEGEFIEPPDMIIGDSGKPEPRFEMMLVEVGNEEARKLVGVKLTQRDRNRAWMEVFQRAGKDIRLQDNVTSQRDGTSFAISDSDYGEKECIVSQGLGTMTVTYQGRTFYVCCSGCQSAFTDDPTFWINKAEDRKKAEKKE